MHERLAVYVPDVDAPATIAAQVAAIDAGSGIVGRKVVEDDPEESPILIYFEGNRFNSVNIRTFADRVYHAADRLTSEYPTVARMLVRPEALLQVGWFYREHGRVDVTGGLELTRLAKWIRLYDDEHDVIHSDDFADELRTTHRRAS